MSTNTPNYNLEKPSQDDFYNVDVQNRNMDKIDTTLKTMDNKIADGVTHEDINGINAKLDDINQGVDEIDTKSDQIKQGVNDIKTKVTALGSNAVNGLARFTTPGAASWTAPEGVKFIKLTMFGGGGGGGGVGTTTSGGWAGSGGGGGAFVINHIVPVTPGKLYDLYVGDYGMGGPSASGGGNGGTTTGFGLTCFGGYGGSAGTGYASITPGGSAPYTSRSIVSCGAYGGCGYISGNNYTPYRLGGSTPKAIGGHSNFITSGTYYGGGGGAGYGQGGDGGVNNTGGVGGYGAGGGGASTSGSTAYTGGTGGNGIIEIVW